MEKTDIIWKVKRDSIRRMIKDNKRLDDRKLDEYRKTEFFPDYIPKAEGSCLVKLGNTQVLVGVKTAVMEPYPDIPNQGVLIVNTELVPLASPVFFSGPPRENSIELSRVVDRGIRESKMIDIEKLCIEPGEKVWAILVDIHVLNYDGNLFDASSMAAVKALLGAKLPKLEDDKINYAEKTIPIPVKDKPVSCTFAKINGVNVLDPILEEIKAMDSRMTFVTNQDGDICAIQKSGSGSYTKSEIDEMIDITIKEGKKIRKKF